MGKNRTDFTLNPTTLDAVVTGLVNQGRAREALDWMEKQIKKDEDKYPVFISSLMTCLAGLAEAGEDQLVLDMLAKTSQDKFIKPTYGRDSFCTDRVLSVYKGKGDIKMVQEVCSSLVASKMASPHHMSILNPLVEVHLTNGDLKAAVAEFERIGKVYKKMVKKYDLLCRLIDQDEVDAIQDVQDISTKIIGEQNSLYDLAYCFLKVGRKAQARKLFDTPGLGYEQGSLEFILGNLRDSGNLQALEDLVNLSKTIFGCDRDMLYLQLVTAFNNDADKISDIWLQVQEEGHAPSDKLKIAIAKALKAGGQTVPFEEPVEYLEVPESKKPTTNSETKATSVPENLDNLLDEEVYTALKISDFNTATEMAVKSIDDKNISLKCKKKVLDVLTNENLLEEATLLATKLANSFENPRNIKFKELYRNIIDKLDDAKKAEFLASLSPVFVDQLDTFRKIPKINTESNPATLKKEQESTKVAESVFAGDVLVKEALDKKDITGILESMSKLPVSYECKNKVLQHLISENRLDEASAVAIEATRNLSKSELNRKNKGVQSMLKNLCEIMKRREEAGEVNKTVEFLKQCGPKVQLLVQGNIWVKTGLAKTDARGYIDLIKADPENTQKWLVNTDVLLEAVEKTPDLLSTLESLAADSFTPANILLSKLCIAQGNSEKFEKFIKLCPTDIQEYRHGGIFDKVDTMEKMDMVVEVLKRNEADIKVLEKVANNCLALNLERDSFVKIAESALDKGIELGSLSTNLLKQLSKNTNFRLHSDVQALLLSRQAAA